MKISSFITSFVTTLLVACTVAGAASTSDLPRLVQWHMIGNIGLGMTATRIEYAYGYLIKRYSDNHLDLRTYRGRGPIDVAYDGAQHAI
jgi:hypothetical protein